LRGMAVGAGVAGDRLAHRPVGVAEVGYAARTRAAVCHQATGAVVRPRRAVDGRPGWRPGPGRTAAADTGPRAALGGPGAGDLARRATEWHPAPGKVCLTRELPVCPVSCSGSTSAAPT